MSSAEATQKPQESDEGKLLHLFAGDLRLMDNQPNRDIVSSFQLIIRREGNEENTQFKMASTSFSHFLVNFRQICHITLDSISTGVLHFDIFVLRRSGERGLLGSACCLASILETNVMKILQFFDEEKNMIAKLSVTISFQSIPSQSAQLNNVAQNRILSQREYNFLLSRRFHWAGERPTSWNREIEKFLDADPTTLLRDVHVSTVNPIHRPCRNSTASKPVEDVFTKVFSRKLRRTNRAVGYVGVSWPDNALYGRQVFEAMRSLEEMKYQQKILLQRKLKDFKSDLNRRSLMRKKFLRTALKKEEDSSLQRMQRQERIDEALGAKRQEMVRRKTPLQTSLTRSSSFPPRTRLKVQSTQLMPPRYEDHRIDQQRRQRSLSSSPRASSHNNIGRKAALRSSKMKSRFRTQPQPGTASLPAKVDRREKDEIHGKPLKSRKAGINFDLIMPSKSSSANIASRHSNKASSLQESVDRLLSSSGLKANLGRSKPIGRSCVVLRGKEQVPTCNQRVIVSLPKPEEQRTEAESCCAPIDSSLETKEKSVEDFLGSKDMGDRLPSTNALYPQSAEMPRATKKIVRRFRKAIKKPSSSAPEKKSATSMSKECLREVSLTKGEVKDTPIIKVQGASEMSGTGSTAKIVRALDSLIKTEKLKTWEKMRELSEIQYDGEAVFGEDTSLMEELNLRNRGSSPSDSVDSASVMSGLKETATKANAPYLRGGSGTLSSASQPSVEVSLGGKKINDNIDKAAVPEEASNASSPMMVPLFDADSQQMAYLHQRRGHHYLSECSSVSSLHPAIPDGSDSEVHALLKRC